MDPTDDTSGDNPPVEPGDAGSAEKPGFGPESALRALEDRLTRASDAAERLIAEAAGAALRTPPSGWAAPGDRGANGRGTGQDRDADGERSRQGDRQTGAPTTERPDPDEDLSTVLAFVRSLRDLIPPDLQRRLAEALRELLLALRALIDWYLERLEQRRKTPTPVEDIPIL